MLIGVGVDIVAVKRIAGVLRRSSERFLNKIYTSEEQLRFLELRTERNKEKSVFFLSSRWALKEAVFKALSPSTLTWRDIATTSNEGKPTLLVSDKLKNIYKERGITNCFISLSHDLEYSVAFVIFES
ncbi:holo-[acyl-carrier-protein] synthase-like [Zophobas morio]|uniref:holo-[acyl-carrier-protein] synthase-like n=1 Tax=Zophobas morio TaxID=2755281 RepID=UPI003083889D